MTYSELKVAIKALDLSDRFDGMALGIRTQEQPFALGRIDHLSLVWDDGSETDEALPGISATNISNDRALRMHCADYSLFDGLYYGHHTAIITGDVVAHGDDLGEIILDNAEVVAILA